MEVVQWFSDFHCQTKPMNQPLWGTAKRIFLTDELKRTKVNLVDGRVCLLKNFRDQSCELFKLMMVRQLVCVLLLMLEPSTMPQLTCWQICTFSNKNESLQNIPEKS